MTNDIAGPYSIGSKVWPGLSKVTEECGELLQVLGKLIGSGGETAHWSGDLRTALLDELADASAAIQFFAQTNLTAQEWSQFKMRNGVKGNRFWRWHVEAGGYTRRFEANALAPAQGTEARRAETENTGSVHDGPVPKECAQNKSST